MCYCYHLNHLPLEQVFLCFWYISWIIILLLSSQEAFFFLLRLHKNLIYAKLNLISPLPARNYDRENINR